MLSVHDLGASHAIPSHHGPRAGVRGQPGVRPLGVVHHMSIQLLHDPDHWRQRAEELRMIAQATKDADARTTVLRIVADYERLAERAQRRRNDQPEEE